MCKFNPLALLPILCFASALLAAATPAIDDTTFSCIRDMTPVRGFYVDNLQGNLDETVAVASAGTGTYPPGSVVQLVPSEAMVKLDAGASPATGDWEFFELAVTGAGSTINKRGFVDVVNKFGGNCFACHIKANPDRDMICETGHGCDPIPLTRTMINAIQNTDPRCEPVALPPEQIEALKQLQAALAKSPQGQ
jgi:hypothetical protein